MSATAKRKRGRIVGIVVALVVVLALAAVVVPLVLASQPSFFDRFEGLQRRHTTLETSVHAGIECVVCHTEKDQMLGAGAALVGEYYRSLVTTSTELGFVTFKPPTSDACLHCHRYDWSNDASKTASVPHPAHLRVSTETRDCVACHKWVAHEEVYQTKHTTMPFSAVCASFQCHVGVKTSKDCQNCHHVLQEETGDWLKLHPPVVQANGPSSCLEFCHKAEQCVLCHTTGKTPVLPSSVPTASAGPIEQAHIKADWLSQHGTIALPDTTKCTICHISQQECVDCHSQRPAFHDPSSTWYARHVDLAKDPKRCLYCHQQAECDACHAKFKETR